MNAKFEIPTLNPGQEWHTEYKHRKQTLVFYICRSANGLQKFSTSARTLEAAKNQRPHIADGWN